MRRIIERVVTVVTTTTWKISWETDTPHASRDQTADSVLNELPNPDVLSETAQSPQPDLTLTETKEVDPPEIVRVPDTSANEPSK